MHVQISHGNCHVTFGACKDNASPMRQRRREMQYVRYKIQLYFSHNMLGVTQCTVNSFTLAQCIAKWARVHECLMLQSQCCVCLPVLLPQHLR